MFHFVRAIEEKQVKIIFLGDDKVGKTSIIRRFAENIFRERYKPTLGVQVFTKENYEYPANSNQKILIYLWDIGAQELYELVRPDYYVGVSGIVFVGDVTRPETIERIRHWANEVKQHVKYPHGWAVALNKIDLIGEEEKKTTKRRREALLELIPEKMRDSEKIFFTSAKNDLQIIELIDCVLSQIIK